MTKQEFLALDEIEKANTLIENGVLIGKRDFISYVVYLYQIDSFYVEVLYSDKLKTIVKLKPFRNIESLNPYLETIDISGLA